jgi:hypothetical protein
MFQNLCTVGQKTAVKVYYAKKVLQLLDVLRGWEIFYFGSMIGVNGRTDKGVASLEQSKNQNVGWNVTHTKTE